MPDPNKYVPGVEVYWGRAEVAEFLGVKTDSINGYDLPPPDALIGNHRGWLPRTIQDWERNRPGRGNWGRH